jgi:integrase
MKNSGTSESYQKNNLKVIISFSVFIESHGLTQFNDRGRIISFLDSKIKTIEEDPEGKWMTTWNDYLARLKFFFRWLHNCNSGNQIIADSSEWVTPDFLRVKKKNSKRVSPYLETEVWERDEIQKIIQYEPNKRNKAIIALAWDLDARPHEITLLKIKHIKLLDRYGEGQIPHEAKTGSLPVS